MADNTYVLPGYGTVTETGEETYVLPGYGTVTETKAVTPPTGFQPAWAQQSTVGDGFTNA